MARWASVRIPEDLYKLIQRVVEEHKEYTSVSDFVVETLRNRLREMGYLK